MKNQLFFLILLFSSFLYAQGPGLPRVTFPPDDINKQISTVIGEGESHSRGNNLGAMVNGYMMIMFAPDGMLPGGGLRFYDLSDPYAPLIVNTVIPDADQAQFVEAHGFGFSGRVSAIQSHKGVMFWDLSDVMAPVLLSNLILSGLTGDGYGGGNFSTFWQAPIAYTASSLYGIHIVDGSDPANPQEVIRLPKGTVGDFLIGNVYAIGNLLVATSVGLNNIAASGIGVSLFDISNPLEPVMVFTSKTLPSCYSFLINGGKIYGAGNDRRVHVIDISDWTAPALEASSDVIAATGGEYIFIQDEFLFSGFSGQWNKLDLQTLAVVGGGELSNGGQEGHPQPYGNFIMLGNDHGEGSGIIPHTAEPDTRGPDVNMVVPAHNSQQQATTSRVGLTFTDQIEVSSINSASFIVREPGGVPLPGTYSSQQAIVNFWPANPLKENTLYEVVVPAGGITDWPGNPVESDFTSTFSTGASSGNQTFYPRPVYVSNSIITVTATSENPGNPVDNIFDGNDSTIWQSNITGGIDPLPFDLVFEFNAPTTLMGLDVTPRLDTEISIYKKVGFIADYELSVSPDGINYTQILLGEDLMYVEFDSVEVKFLRLRILDGVSGSGSAAEVKFIEKIVMTELTSTIPFAEIRRNVIPGKIITPGYYSLKGKKMADEKFNPARLPPGIYLQISPAGKRKIRVSL